MARIQLGRPEVERRDLPFVCLKCGRPASLWKTKRFLLASPSGAASLGKLTQIRVPMCSAHKNHWFWRGLFGGGVGGALVALFIVGLLAVAEPGEVPRAWRDILLVGWVVGFFGLVLWLPVMLVLHFTAVRPLRITNDDITLTGVSPAFVGRLKEYRWLPSGERKAARQAGRRRGYDPEAGRLC